MSNTPREILIAYSTARGLPKMQRNIPLEEAEAAIKAYIEREIIGEDEPRIKELDRKPESNKFYRPRNLLRAEQRAKLKELS